MTDTFAASLAFLAAGIALLTYALSWPTPFKPVVTVIAVITLLVLALRRHGNLPRTTAATISAIAGIAITTTAIFALPASTQTTGPLLAGGSGLLILGFAFADARAFTRTQILTKLQATSAGLALGFLGLLAVLAWTVLLRTALNAAWPNTIVFQAMTAGLALALATLTVTGLFLTTTNRTVEFLDFVTPRSRDVGYVLGGLTTILALNFIISVVARQAGFTPIQHNIVQSAQSTPSILLPLIPLSVLLIGPSEELLYRNVIQKLLYGAYSRPAAIVVTSLIFASTHLFAYSTSAASLAPTITALGGVFVLSVVLGVVYERTGNILVPMAVHGVMNAIIFAAVYVQLTTP